MKLYLRAPACALALLCALLPENLASFHVRAASATGGEDVNACVGFQNEYGDHLLVVHADNDCQRLLACTLSHTLRCEDNDGKTTSRSARQAYFRLGPKGKADVTLSAASCKQGWFIDDVAWTCR